MANGDIHRLDVQWTNILPDRYNGRILQLRERRWINFNSSDNRNNGLLGHQYCSNLPLFSATDLLDIVFIQP